MKNQNFNYILLLFVMFLMNGCVKEEDLVQSDPNMETTASFWENGHDALLGINSVYGSLLTDGTYMRSTPIMLDVKADGARSNSPWIAMFNMGRFNTNVADPSIYGWAYETYYQGIYRANQVLEKVPGIKMENEALKTRILGQAYFLRGLFFFHAVKLFKNVPLPTNTEIYHEQKTQKEGWAQIISDLKKAAEMLPLNYSGVTGPDAGQKGRATKGAAHAYLGKAYLFNENYELAKKYFKLVIDSGEYALVEDYSDNFTLENENNSESIFEVQFSREAGGVDLGWGGAPASGWGKTSARAITYAPRGFGFTDLQPTWTLFNAFFQEKTVNGEVDPRLNVTIAWNDPDGYMLYGVEFATFYANSPSDLNDIFVNKYQNSGGYRANEFDWRSGINERIMRYAGVLLMYAEALNATGNTQGAYTYVQMVRDRVNLPDLKTVKPNMTKQEMFLQIAHERFLELALEGHRFDDIRRWGWLDTRLDWLKARDPEFESYTSGREYFPIPQFELDNNPGTVQNPGY